jgi:hypothetical protein
MTSATGKADIELTAEPTVNAVPPPPILITEKEVLFSTAAAAPTWLRKMRRWPQAIYAVRTAMHWMFLTSTVDGCRPHQHYPKHYQFLERSLMAPRWIDYERRGSTFTDRARGLTEQDDVAHSSALAGDITCAIALELWV